MALSLSPTFHAQHFRTNCSNRPLVCRPAFASTFVPTVRINRAYILRVIGTPRLRHATVRAAMEGKATPGQTTLGFVGIGIMGFAMCNNLIKAGYKVVVYNRNAEKCAPLVKLGAEMASSPQQVAEKASSTFVMVSDPDAAKEVAFGKMGVLAGLSAGKAYVDVSTVDAETSTAIAEGARGKGAVFLEAPVSGSKAPAENGQLIFLCGGDRAAFDFCEHPLSVMGKASFFLGEAGQGAKMKLVVNMIMGSMMAAFSEGLALADKSGLSKEQLVEVLGLGAINAPMFQMKGPAMCKGSFPTAFPLKHQQKDLRLALSLGDRLEQPLPVASAANQLFVSARERGHGDDDFSAVLTAVMAQMAAQSRQ